ncbi:MAG: SMODS domain-containing nucleotidyltransferase, partial [Thermoanaerobaculia bacterium]
VLSSFARAIRRRYAESAVWLQRRSVRLELAHVHIDVVPAVQSRISKDMILLPDRQKGSWITSAPKIHAALSTSVNARNGGLFKPVVKLLKAWNGTLPANARFKSFAVETMATRVFSAVTITSLADGCLLFFDFVASLDGRAKEYKWSSRFGMTFDWTDKVIPDTAGTASNLASRVSDDQLAGFISGAVQARTRLLHAQRARSSEKAKDWLRKIFGVTPA